MRRTRPLGPLPAGTSTTSRPGHPAHAGDPQESCGYGQSTRPCARRLTILSLPPPPLHPPAHSQPPPSLRPPPLALVILRGPAAGRTLAPSPAKAGATTLTVGRKAGRDFHIPDTSVSEQHALFEWEARPPPHQARAGGAAGLGGRRGGRGVDAARRGLHQRHPAQRGGGGAGGGQPRPGGGGRARAGAAHGGGCAGEERGRRAGGWCGVVAHPRPRPSQAPSISHFPPPLSLLS